MTYSGLYRCSGCSVTFADPSAWRESGASSVPEEESGMSVASPPPTPSSQNLLSTWGATPGVRDPSAFGYNDADQKAITEAADRANKSKGRRR